ncbi:MAG: substrate-binding protein [Gemmatimonadaceae bacterium]|nr:substrate-binding protein [Gemmatimonadaceae bacterium]
MERSNETGRPIKVGVIADQSGPLSFAGLANANVARMVIGDINAKGGLLGRPLELLLEDSATDDATAAACAARLVAQRADVILGGIYSSTRQAIKAEAVTKGKTLYIYPEQYEGEESDPRIFCTGPVPAQQVTPFIPWLMKETGARKFFLPSADYIWPRVMNRKVRDIVTANGGAIVGEEYFPLDHTDYVGTVQRIMASGAEVVFNTTVPPGVGPFLAELHAAGFQQRGGKLVCLYFDENFLNMVPPEHVEGLYSCLDYYQAVDEPFSRSLLNQYDALYPGHNLFTAGSACTGLYRGLRLWEAAVTEAGTVETDAVVRALDHASIAQGPGGPAAMVPGEHHVRMSMYIAQSHHGTFEVIKHLGPVDPHEKAIDPTASPTHSTENPMLLATTTVADFDQFMKIFSTGGAELRAKHGSKGAKVFRDPNQADRVWVVFDWDAAGWQNFVSDPAVPPVMKEAGHTSKPQGLALAGECVA